jgi:hypothetical protein
MVNTTTTPDAIEVLRALWLDAEFVEDHFILAPTDKVMRDWLYLLGMQSCPVDHDELDDGIYGCERCDSSGVVPLPAEELAP